jgi:osmotically-inducible protein OsmY
MKLLTTTVELVLVMSLAACSSTERERAKERGDADLRKATEETRKAGKEIKAEAQDLSRRVDASVQPDRVSASEKMSHAEADLKQDASRAGAKLDRAALLAKVKTSLVSDAGLSTLSNVEVEADGSVVTLSGTVANANQKKAAEMAASQVDGVTKVRNRLVVQP